MSDPIFVCVPAAGSSWSSFSPVISRLNELRIAPALAVDFIPDADESMSQLLESLNECIFKALVNTKNEKRSVVLVGHSSAGCWITKLAASKTASFPLTGLVLIDTIEGQVMDDEARERSVEFLRKIPKRFSSVEDAATYHVDHGLSNNIHSARIALEGSMTKFDDHVEFAHPLLETEKMWTTWFSGTSALFVEAPDLVTKAFITASVEPLDKTLTIGRFQGKYRIELIPSTANEVVGHFVHEDAPGRTCEALMSIYRKHVENVAIGARR